ncbi:MAG: hypothetical protein WA949_14585 [Phormidesmis sp.]
MNSVLFEHLQPYLDIAVSILGTKDVAAIEKLKFFLVALPNQRQIEQILASAVLHTAEHEQSIFYWVVENREVLAPELELSFFLKRRILSRLRDRGWVRHRDFEIDIESRSLTLQRTYSELIDCFSQGEWLLIQSIFEVEIIS